MRYIFLFLVFNFSIYCAAEGRSEGKIEMLQVGEGWTKSGVYVLIKMNTEVSGQPSCATDERMAIDPATELGKSLYSSLLSAKHAGTTVEVVGTNSCDVMGSSFESIKAIRLK